MYEDSRWECLRFLIKVTHNCEYITIEILIANILYFTWVIWKIYFHFIYYESTVSPSKKYPSKSVPDTKQAIAALNYGKGSV